MSHSPPELIYDILSRLPVKPLLRFMCVCESWNSLIHSSTFIQAHFNLHRLKLIIFTLKEFYSNSPTRYSLRFDFNLLSCDFNSLSCGNSIQLEYLEPPPPPPPPKKQLSDITKILGSCHGKVLISNQRYGNFDISMDRDYALWSPSTGAFRKLPICHSNPPQGPPVKDDQLRAGFGHDMIAHDYKAVKISQWSYDDNPGFMVSEIMVYSLKSDLWRKVVQDFPCWLVQEEIGMFAGGALYWFACERPPYPGDFLFLVRFDLGSERFEQVPYPDKLDDPVQLNLAVLGDGCLSLLCSYVDGEAAEMDYLSHVDIWGTKDCGQHWVKLFSVKQLNGPERFNFVKLIACLQSTGEVLLEIDHKKFMWYSLIKKSLRPVKINVGLDYFKSFVCMETLVPLYGGGNEKAKKKKIEPNEESIAKKFEKRYEFQLEHQKQLERSLRFGLR